MPGYVFCMGTCISCRRPFSFNPHFVPSVVVNGKREPVCANCVRIANPKRRVNGLPEIVPHPNAYEALPEEEL